MRRPCFAVVAAIAALVIAGCGSSGTGSAGTPSPTVRALSYFPVSTPFVMTVATDPKSSAVARARALQRRFPLIAVAQTALFARLSRLGIDYNRDIRPLFGNPVAVGSVGPALSGTSTPILISWVTRSQSSLATLIKKVGFLRSAGSHDGAKLYVGSGAAVAIEGATVLFARSTPVLESALDRHAHGQGFDAARYARATTGISPGGVIQVFGDLTGVLAAPSAATARRVPWVAAIRGYGVSITVGQAGVSLQYHVDTTGGPLSASQLPIASGATSPGVAGDLPVQAAVRNPAQIISFGEAAERETMPAAYAKFLRRQAQLKRVSGFDFNALAAMLTGDLTVESDTHTTIARAQVSSPAVAATMLAKVARTHGGGGLLTNGQQISSLGRGLYAIRSAKQTLTVGVIGDQLVLGRATAAQLRAFAAAPTTAATSQTGSVSFRIALLQLLRITLKHAPSATEQQLLGLLGDVTGSASATTGGLTGSATLGFR